MNRAAYKETITKVVLEHCDQTIWNFEKAIKSWWYNPRKDGGLRLTQVGDLEFRYADLENHTHNFNTKKISKSYYQFVLELDKKMKCPYYMDIDAKTKTPFIRLYDSRISMMLNLYGDIDSYLNSIKGR
jgi:hypothetical protein